ncbi:MAG TPA: UDP-N-acetylmuramoyl-tripeptide--D-alanyl-D-alanine ligase [Anaerolineales bacterium]|nr:UDP-N-acetylmuramoyl-tripeptide--D-alanyl-D-alanine ligase [Anaerolineales bacterium]HRQ92825.1 UDP-N-acetylmuramoyl-tripeptide--D-alanyl-D-alanine ligase [Anaerolineales bacterium]
MNAVKTLTLAEIIEALCAVRPAAAEAIALSGAVHDSREAQAGSLFVALRGEHVDGHEYVAAAFANGARAALVERPLDGMAALDLRRGQRPAAELALDTPICIVVDDVLLALQQAARAWRRTLSGLRVVGITGSVGKTTTKELTADVLNQRFRTFKSAGNYNNEIGLPLSVLSITPDTERAVLEMGFYVPGEIALLADIAVPELGVVTNIGTVHASRAGSQEAIYRGKAELVQNLPSDGVAILNYDDPFVKRMAGETKARVFFYGLDPAADLWADEVEGLGLDGVRFRLHYQGETLHVRIPLIGRHSVHTALRAAAVGLIEGMDWGAILSGLRIGNAQLRLMAVPGRNGSLLLDDTYNASPESTSAALNLLSELEGRKVAVLGDMLELGQYEEQGHRVVGNLAARVADVLITVGARAHIIAETAQGAGLAAAAIHEFADTDGALAFLSEALQPSDVVLVKGSRAVHMDKIVPYLEEKHGR